MSLNQIIILLIILIVFANVQIPFINTPLFYILQHPITLAHLIIFGFLLWIYKYLPSPFRELVIIFLLLWVLSLTGIFFFIGWLANIFLVFIVIILIISIL